MEDIQETTHSSRPTYFVQTSFIIQFIMIVLFVPAINLSACFSKCQVLSLDPRAVTLAVLLCNVHI